MIGKNHQRVLLLCLFCLVIPSCTAAFTDQELADLRTQFDQFDADKNGHITTTEIGDILKALGESLPGYQIRDMITEVDMDENGTVEFSEFVQMYERIQSGKKFKLATLAEKAKKLSAGGQAGGSTEGTTHSFSEEEKIAFADWINYQLEGDADVQSVLPISSEGTALFDALKDGIILCKMINKAVPNTIDERSINKANLNTFTISDNQRMVLNSAASIGANIVNIGPQDLMEGRPHLVLGLLWQIIRTSLLGRISLQNNRNLPVLLKDGESLSDILGLSPESLLLRWVNYHLEQSVAYSHDFEVGDYHKQTITEVLGGYEQAIQCLKGKRQYVFRLISLHSISSSNRQINNFGKDIQDSEAYTILLTRVAPPDAGVDTSPLGESVCLEIHNDQEEGRMMFDTKFRILRLRH